jgi:uncharacterized protein
MTNMNLPGIFLFVFIFFSCSAQTDKGKLLGYDYRLFQDTPVWELAKAVRSNDSTTVTRILKDNKINLNYQEAKFGETLLMLTVKNQQYEMCRKLLELGADPNVHNHADGSSAIIDAADIYSTGTEFVQLLLIHGANPNDEEVGERSEGNTRRDTPLLNASETKLEIVKLLIDAGAKINYVNEFGTTALRRSVIQDKIDVAFYLLERGASHRVSIINRQSKDLFLEDFLREKMLPLDSEDYQWKMKIIDFLLTKGINYKNLTIPEFVVKKAKEEYPNSWQEYLDRY